MDSLSQSIDSGITQDKENKQTTTVQKTKDMINISTPENWG